MKFKVIPQISIEDCAAACVSMILKNYFDKDVSLCEIRPLIKNTQEGTSFGDLDIGMNKMGISTTIFEASKEMDTFKKIKVPVITQIKNEDNDYHYIVVYKITQKYIYYADPSSRNVKKEKIDNFISIWINYIIQINIEKSTLELSLEENLSSINYRSLISSVKFKLIFIIILSILIYISGIVLTSLYSTYFNVLIPNKLQGLINTFMFSFLIVLLFQSLLSLLSSVIMNALNKNIDKKLSSYFFESLFTKSKSSLNYFGIGEIITTLSNIILIRERLITWIVLLPINIFWLFTSIYLLYQVNKLLMLLTLVLLVVLSIMVVFVGSGYEEKSSNLLNSNKHFNDKIMDIFKNKNTIKNYQQEEEYTQRGIAELNLNINTKNKLLNFEARINILEKFILESFNVLLFSIGTYLIINGKLSTGSLLTYNSIIGFAMNPLLSLLSSQSLLIQGKVANDLLRNFLNNNINLFGTTLFPTEVNNIVFDNVSFTYNGRKKLLNKINLSIENENTIAIVGNNGSGKSTFGKLIARHEIVDKGQIKINNYNINEFKEAEINKNILFVDSEEGMLSTSIMDNITLGRDIDELIVLRVCKELGIDNFVNKLEDGYNTQLSENGVNLSLGQKQLIKIARSTLEEKKIYIFDEVTNGLDSKYRENTINYLLNLPGKKLFITHDDEFSKKQDLTININNFT